MRVNDPIIFGEASVPVTPLGLWALPGRRLTRDYREAYKAAEKLDREIQKLKLKKGGKNG